MLVWAGCGDSAVRTYRIAPYLEPGTGVCGECSIGLTLFALEEGADPPSALRLYASEFERGGFTFRWGVEQVVEIGEHRYDTGDVQDSPGVRYSFRSHLSSHPVEPGSRFEMKFRDAPPGNYPYDFLVRTGDVIRIGKRVDVACDSPELCDQLAARELGVEGFALELSYPASEGGPLQLHSIRALP
ncbi:hypothetical protein ACLESO_52720 [Pyxidicoccus sp. 3LG]